MNTATLLHFPIERTTPPHDHTTKGNDPLTHSQHNHSQVIPFRKRKQSPLTATGPKSSVQSIKVNTRLYRTFHPLPPKGIRSWGFALGSFTTTFWVHGLPFPIAVKSAIKEAQRLGAEQVIVLP